MNNNIITIIIGVVITLFAGLYLGTSLADGKNTPLIIVGCVLGLIVLFSFKEKIWALLVITPFITYKIPFSILSKLDLAEIATMVVFPFLIFNVFLNRIKLSWRTVWYLDVTLLVFMSLIVALMIRYPIGLALSWDSEYMDSRAYFDLILATVFYICLSLIKPDIKTVQKILIVGIFAWFFFSLLDSFNALTGRYVVENVSEQITQSRFSAFLQPGIWLVLFCITRNSVTKMITKPWLSLSGALGLVCVTLSGFRSALGSLGLSFIFVTLINRRFIDFLLAPLILSSILLGSSLMFGVTNLPAGIQRSISFLPFVEVRADIKTGARESTIWRQTMWKWALDEHEQLIKDPVWGDGFALKKADHFRLAYSSGGDNKEEFARRGLWHSGPISSIQKIGYVGLIVVIFLFLGLSYYAYLVCKSFRKEPYGWAVHMCIIPVIAIPIEFIFIFGEIKFFHTIVFKMAVVKFFFNLACDNNLYQPLRRHKEYIPLMVRNDQITVNA